MEPLGSIGTIKYKSANSKIAVVDSNGVVYGIKKGSTKITATMGKKSITTTVKVTNRNVTNVSVAASDFNSSVISFNPMTDINTYQIYLSTRKNKGYKKLATVNADGYVMYQHTGMKTGTKYYYKVRGVLNINGKEYYGPFSGVKATKAFLEAPIINTFSGVSNIFINSSKVPGASGYQYYYKIGAKGKYKNAQTINSTSYVIKGLAGGKDYYVKVRAYITIGKKKIYGPFSNVIINHVDKANPVIQISDMYYGYSNKSTVVKPDIPEYDGMTWVQFTVSNNGGLDLVLYDKVGYGGKYPVTSMYLANSSGTRKSSITIKPGKSAKIRIVCKKGFSWGKIEYNTQFYLRVRYDGLYYRTTFVYNSTAYTQIP